MAILSFSVAAPLVESLTTRATDVDMSSFTFPGHSSATGAPSSMASLPLYAYDYTPPDSLFTAHGSIAAARSKAAALFGAEDTHFLVNGSSCGVHAAIMATCAPGQTLILGRNSHKSAAAGLVLSGAVPMYIMPCFDPHWDIAHGVHPSAIECAFAELKQMCIDNVGAVLVTSPTYFGICSDIAQIARICHSRRIPLIVDEAHGGHFCFHTAFPASALQQGADLVVQSTHKVLTSLTQSAMLHVQGELVDRRQLCKCLQALQTTSPNSLLLASLDASREQMSAGKGEELFGKALALAEEAREALKEVAGLEVIRWEEGSGGKDPFRIAVAFRPGLAIGTAEVEKVLCTKYKVIPELRNFDIFLFPISIGTRVQDVQRLVQAFEAISKEHYKNTGRMGSLERRSPINVSAALVPPARSRLSPTQAFYAAAKVVDAEVASGHVCAEIICPYPPGIPTLVPGEVISHEAVLYLRGVVLQGGVLQGASDPSAKTFLVCQE